MTRLAGWGLPAAPTVQVHVGVDVAVAQALPCNSSPTTKASCWHLCRLCLRIDSMRVQWQERICISTHLAICCCLLEPCQAAACCSLLGTCQTAACCFALQSWLLHALSFMHRLKSVSELRPWLALQSFVPSRACPSRSDNY